MTYRPKGATAATAEANRRAVDLYDMDDREDFETSARGLVAPIPGGVVPEADGSPWLDLNKLDFIEGEAPDTVEPSLWRQSLIMRQAGLY